MLSPPWPSLSGQTTVASLRFSFFLTLSPPLPLWFWQRGWCFRFRTFPLAPFGEALSSSRHGPSDLTTAGAVNLPLWRCRSRQTRQHPEEVQQRLPLFAPSLIIVCTAVWRCLFLPVDIWLSVDVWYVLAISVMCECHSRLQNSPLWDVMFDTVVLAQKYGDNVSRLHSYTHFIVSFYFAGMFTRSIETEG